jgi:hypothetical protein
MLVKKEKVFLTWNYENIPINSTYTIDLLTNATYNENGFLTCGEEVYTIVNNLTTSYYKWKTIKLNKYNSYSFFVTVEGTNIYGASKIVPYVPDFWKYIKKGEQRPFISNGRGEDVFNKNGTVVAGMVSAPEDIEYTYAVVDEDGKIIDGVDIEGLIKSNKQESEHTSKSIYHILFTGLVLSAFIIVMSVTVQKYRKINDDKKSDLEKFSDNYYPHEFGQDINLEEIKSDTSGSEVLREKLKQEALQIERNKVLESMKEKNLTSELSSSNNYLTVAGTSEVVSNAVSNSNTDYSWHNMEVLTFSPPLKINKPINTNEKAGPALSISSIHEKESLSDIHLDDDQTKDITDSQDSNNGSEGGSSDKLTLNNEKGKEPSIEINVV